MNRPINVTIWNEFRHEKWEGTAQDLYPNGLHVTIKEALQGNPDFNITLAALDDPDQGLPEEVLNNTDVLIWWGHMSHHEVDDGLVERIRERVYRHGMGFIPLHSAHHSKPFRAILGTTGDLVWGDNQQEIIWNVHTAHPIAKGIGQCIHIEDEELYGEPFFIPQPDEQVFISWFKNGNIFRSGCCYYRGCGKIFYFQPGHETCPSYHNPQVIQVISNAIYWASNCDPVVKDLGCPYVGVGEIK